MPHKPDTAENGWPHRLAWAVACATFLLFVSGGLVTSYQAGAAVPEGSSTLGRFFWVDSAAHWFTVWDVFLEHGHRLVGVIAGSLSILLAAVLWRCDSRTSIRGMGVAVALGVLVEGTIGGLRAPGGQILLARIHGGAAPILFLITTTLVTLTSPRWLYPEPAGPNPRARAIERLAWATTFVIYLDIVLGAPLRHVALASSPGWFPFWLWLHGLASVGVLAGVLALFVLASRRPGCGMRVIRRARILAGLFFFELVLGVAAWVTSYGWPRWFVDTVWDLEYTVVAEGRMQIVSTTAHMIGGPLMLAAAWSVAMWSSSNNANRSVA